MQVFKAFFKSSLKYLPSNLIYFVIFAGIAFAISFYSSDSKNSGFQTVSLDIGIIDEDTSRASCALKEYLETLHTLTPLKYDKEVLLDRLFYRDSDYILILPEGFEERLLAGEDDGLFETLQVPGIYSSAFIDGQINSYIKTLRLYLAGDFALDEAIKHTSASLSDASNQVCILEQDMEKTSSTMTQVFFFYKFLPYVMLSMILCGLTPILILFWERDLAKRISCSSTSLINRNLQLASGSIVYCFLIWMAFVLTSGIYYGSDLFSEKGLLCIANSFLLLPLGAAISLVICSFSPSSNSLNLITNIICLGMSFVCGIFVPQQQLGENVLAYSKFLPLYWYIKNNDLISGFGEETLEMKKYWHYFGMQILFIIAVFAAALAISKIKSRRQKA